MKKKFFILNSAWFVLNSKKIELRPFNELHHHDSLIRYTSGEVNKMSKNEPLILYFKKSLDSIFLRFLFKHDITCNNLHKLNP